MDQVAELKTQAALDDRIGTLESSILPRSKTESESVQPLVTQLRELQRKLLQVESQCPGFASASEKFHILREDLGVELIPTTTAQVEHRNTAEKLAIGDPVKRAILLDSEDEVNSLCEGLELVDSLKDSVSSPFHKSMAEEQKRLSKAEQQLASYAGKARQVHENVQALLARYSVAMEALSLQVVAWDEHLTMLEEQVRNR